MRFITNEYAFSFAPDGWNYFSALVAEYDQDPSVRLEDTTFFRFFKHEQIRATRYFNDVLFLHDVNRHSQRDGYNFYHDTCPWGGWFRNSNAVGGRPWGYYYDRLEGKMTRDLFGYRRNHWYQPGDEYPLEIEWKHTIKVYHSLKKGYRPLWRGTIPEVRLLARSDGEMRAVKHNGQHRLSVLSHLGYDTVTVAIPLDCIGVVHESEVDQWYYVRNGLCTKEQALDIFYAFFELSGRERVEYLGLPSVY